MENSLDGERSPDHDGRPVTRATRLGERPRPPSVRGTFTDLKALNVPLTDYGLG